MANLEGKVAIVTGGSRDIGRSCSIKLAEAGAKVVVNYHSNKAAGEETVATIEKAGGSAILVKGDMMKKADVVNLIAEARKAFGDDIHVLVNNVGGLVARKTVTEMDEDFFNHVMSLNMNSTFLATQAVVPHMPAGSAIVNLASLAGQNGGGNGSSAYCTSKVGPQGIRVNALNPGMIATTFHDTFSTDEARRNVEATVPLRRQGHPDDCADTVVYLASDASSYITGANIDINGGMYYS